MLDRIKREVSEIASFIRSQPPMIRVALYGLLGLVAPGITIVIISAGGSLTVAASPVVLVVGTIWLLATRL